MTVKTLPSVPGAAPSSTSSVSSAASLLARDPFLRAFVVSLAALAALLLVPAVPSLASPSFGTLCLPSFIIAWAALGAWFRLGRIPAREDRRFWAWIGTGFCGWLTALLIYALVPLVPALNRWGNAVGDGVFLASYAAWFLGLETRPHRGVRPAIAAAERRLTFLGMACMVVGWLAYAVIVPALRGGFFVGGLQLSRFVFVVLDIVLASRLALLLRDADRFRWRAVYGLLLLGVMGLAVLNSLDCPAGAREAGSWTSWPFPALWMSALVGFVVATRIRHVPDLEAVPVETDVSTPSSGLEPIWSGSFLVLGAFTFPAVHVALRAMAVESSRDGQLESLVVATGMLSLGGLAALAYRSLDRQRASLHRERHELESRMMQAQKMEAIGRLAGGVAHDFNNLLTAIGGYADLARESLRPGHSSLDALAQVRIAADRAAALTKQLLAFSRRQLLKPEPLQLNRTVIGLEPALRQVVGVHVELRTCLDPDLGWASADASQMEQVLLNLVVNARDAMPAGGTVTISTANGELQPADVEDWPAVTPGPCIRLEVRDTGAGIPPDVLPQIFEPFFTTKTAGAGTGLGLSMVYGILRQSGGTIAVKSQEHSGTVFSILAAAHPRPARRERVRRRDGRRERNRDRPAGGGRTGRPRACALDAGAAGLHRAGGVER